MAEKKKIKQRPDFTLLAIIGVLFVWGIATVAFTSFGFSIEQYGQPWGYLFHQLTMVGVGLVGGLIFYKLPAEKIKKVALAFFILNIVLLALVLLPKIGHVGNGAQRWLALGGFTMQPSEILKITFILYLSAWLSSRAGDKKPKSHLRILATFVVILAILVLILMPQSDLSTLGIICIVGVAIYFSSMVPWWHILILIPSGAGLAFIFIKNVAYRLQRLMTFLNPSLDPQGSAFQVNQALIAIGSGQIFGIGGGFQFGMSKQKELLPHPMTDSIFAIIGEEAGFLGASLLVILFLLFLFWSLRIAMRTDSPFKKFVIVGISVWISFQAFFNIAGIIGVAPLGGVPLPFFSYGGSHIITELAAMGILLNFSKRHA